MGKELTQVEGVDLVCIFQGLVLVSRPIIENPSPTLDGIKVEGTRQVIMKKLGACHAHLSPNKVIGYVSGACVAHSLEDTNFSSAIVLCYHPLKGAWSL